MKKNSTLDPVSRLDELFGSSTLKAFWKFYHGDVLEAFF